MEWTKEVQASWDKSPKVSAASLRALWMETGTLSRTQTRSENTKAHRDTVVHAAEVVKPQRRNTPVKRNVPTVAKWERSARAAGHISDATLASVEALTRNIQSLRLTVTRQLQLAAGEVRTLVLDRLVAFWHRVRPNTNQKSTRKTIVKQDARIVALDVETIS
jgi:hypothetical protein